jgi:hypothetical protein
MAIPLSSGRSALGQNERADKLHPSRTGAPFGAGFFSEQRCPFNFPRASNIDHRGGVDPKTGAGEISLSIHFHPEAAGRRLCGLFYLFRLSGVALGTSSTRIRLSVHTGRIASARGSLEANPDAVVAVVNDIESAQQHIALALQDNESSLRRNTSLLADNGSTLEQNTSLLQDDQSLLQQNGALLQQDAIKLDVQPG